MLPHSATACIFVIFGVANSSLHFSEVNQLSREQRQQLAPFERTLGALNTALAHQFCTQIYFELKPAHQTAKFNSVYNIGLMPLNKFLNFSYPLFERMHTRCWPAPLQRSPFQGRAPPVHHHRGSSLSSPCKSGTVKSKVYIRV